MQLLLFSAAVFQLLVALGALLQHTHELVLANQLFMPVAWCSTTTPRGCVVCVHGLALLMVVLHVLEHAAAVQRATVRESGNYAVTLACILRAQCTCCVVHVR